MNRSLRGFSLVGVFVVLMAALVFNGCSNNSPLAPDPENLLSTSKLVSKDLTSSASSGPESLCETQKVIDADDGGQIDIVHGDYSHEFIVAPASIDDDTQITVKTSREVINGKDAIVFEFGPDGLVFSEAAKLNFEMGDLDSAATTAALLYFDPRTNDWIIQDSEDVSRGEVEFDIYHFSKYAISD